MEKKSLLKKFNLIAFASLLFLLITFSFFSGKVFAADAIPDGGRIPCKDSTDPSNPEFASDRPYQASPCGDRPVSYWCGNDVVIKLATVKVPYCDRQSGQATECECKGAQCDQTKNILVDLTDVQLPILGNTQLTKNSESSADQIDDGTKVSNYVAWYLEGTNTSAEYGFSDPKTGEGLSKILDTSGPLKKLLPSIVQDASRIQTIGSADTKITYTDTNEEDPKAPQQSITENQNHNQIVVCASPSILGLFGPVKVHECYPDGGGKPASDYYRMLDWKTGSIGILRDVSNLIVRITKIIPFIGNFTSTAWDKRYPPLPWSDENGKPFASDLLYRKAYSEWRGRSCIIIPFFNQLVCIDNPLVTNKWADLYQYVPLANTVDKKGAHVVANTHITAPKATLTETSYVINHSPQLYLAHSLESYQLSTQLMNTYKPQDTTTNGDTAGVSGSTIPNDVEKNTQCRIVPSRTNSGDDATFDNPASQIDVDAHYVVGMIECTDIHEVCNDTQSDYLNNGVKYRCHWEANCSSDIYATVNTVGKFAYNNEIWNNTVAGSDSIFRRIYPKTGAGSPVSCIADTPASSNATYTLQPSSVSDGLELLRVQEPDKSNVKSEDGIVANAQLYYPHLGGVLDYFLNGIQQALRPQGLGPGQPTDGQYCNNIQCGDLPAGLPKASGSCSLSSSVFGSTTPQSLLQIISAAAETYKVPPKLILGVMYGEGAFNPGRYNWTDQNVKNWATCEPLPNCSPGGNLINSIVPFYGVYWNNLATSILPDLQKIDPTKAQADPCNLLDATFALAKDLHDDAGGSGDLTGKSCFGIQMSSTNPTSCSWNNSQIETSIRVWEGGTAYDGGCFTVKGSCISGGGTKALCPGGGDTCDTINNRYSGADASHNGCVFNVATGGGQGNF